MSHSSIHDWKVSHSKWSYHEYYTRHNSVLTSLALVYWTGPIFLALYLVAMHAYTHREELSVLFLQWLDGGSAADCKGIIPRIMLVYFPLLLPSQRLYHYHTEYLSAQAYNLPMVMDVSPVRQGSGAASRLLVCTCKGRCNWRIPLGVSGWIASMVNSLGKHR